MSQNEGVPTNPNVDKAAQIIKNECRASAAWQVAAECLDAAGLLLTPLHERALKACEGIEQAGHSLNENRFDRFARCADICREVGRESLAARKPVESWTANGSELWLNGRFFSGFRSHAEAKAVQAALNALEAK